MDIDDLPDPGELWWPFAVLAAIDRAQGRRVWTLDAGNHLLSHDGPDGEQIRLQRMYGGRLVLWGNPAGEAPLPVSWSGIPGWATSDVVRRWLRQTGATLLAWHHHDEWDGATPDADAGAVLAPLLNADVPSGLLAAARSGKATARDVLEVVGEHADPERGLAVLQDARQSGAPVQGRIKSMLSGEIHAQMRRTPERDRVLPQRPANLVRWSRVASPPPGFRFTVRADRGRLVPDPESDTLSDQFRTQLLSVLGQLLADEASEDGGAWLYARVQMVGPRMDFERRFDSLPDWYTDTPHSLESLRWEMDQRHRDWRPAWAALLPGGE